MRKLASIQVIENLLPINGADFIELAFVEGWQCIVKKGLHSIGEKVVFCEVDSFLPIKEQYEFLRQSSYKNSPLLGEGFRIKSMKMKKVLSQGLIIPLSDLEQTSYVGSFEVGEDVTDALEIRKWEVPESANLAGFARGNFPTFIFKTDQPNYQNISRTVKSLDLEYEITEKCEGSSCTFFYNEGEVGVCSRNLQLKLDQENNSFVDVAKRDHWLETLEAVKKNVAIQGELIGPGIQGNIYQLLKFEFYIFDIFLIDQRRYATTVEREEILNVFKLTNNNIVINTVPVLGISKLPPNVLEFAEGKSQLNSKTEREGVVFKSTTLVNNNTFSFKAKSNKYLLKQSD